MKKRTHKVITVISLVTALILALTYVLFVGPYGPIMNSLEPETRSTVRALMFFSIAAFIVISGIFLFTAPTEKSD
jgi:Na+-driven multidrug efflux pump